MRRLIRQPAQQPKQVRPKQVRPQQPTLSAKDLATLPAALLATLPPPVPSKPRPQPVKRRYEPIDDEFISKRSPGSKTVLYRRPLHQPTYTLADKLNRTNVLSREDDTFEWDGHTYHAIEWVCTRQLNQEDVNLHLVDFNAPKDPLQLHYILHVTLESEPAQTEYLLDTPAGRVCPKCRSNEYIKSDLKNMPVSFHDAHWRNRDHFGEYCEVCRTISARRN